MQIKNMTQHVIGKLAPGQTREIDSYQEEQRVRKSAAFRAGHLQEGNPPMPAIMYEPLGSDSEDATKRSRLRIDMETDRQVLARWAQDLDTGGDADRLRRLIRDRMDYLLEREEGAKSRGEAPPDDLGDLSHLTRAATRQPVPPPLPERREQTNEGPAVVPQAMPDGPAVPPVPPPPPPPPPPDAPGKPPAVKSSR